MNRILVIVLTLGFLAACSTQQPIHNISRSSVPLRSDGSLLTLKEVSTAISMAARIKGWKSSSLDEGAIEIKINVRDKHKAIAIVKYSSRNYSITLKKSVGLDERAGKIHRNYNKWIMLLDEKIQTELIGAATE